ncbi:MAG: DUF2630 family protein, partial [Acidimicrobiales bacterium]
GFNVDDMDLVAEIGRLTDEEHKLEQAHVGEGLSSEEAERLRKVETALDQCWDLLRQRRARLQYGLNPDEAKVRPTDVVEDYQQ